MRTVGLIFALVCVVVGSIAIEHRDYVYGVPTIIIALVVCYLSLKPNRNKNTKKKAIDDDLGDADSLIQRGEELDQAKKEMSPYFQYLEKITQNAARNPKIALAYVDKTIPILTNFVNTQIKAYGSFDINTIPAIDTGCRYWPILGQAENIEMLSEALNQRKELMQWLPSIEQAKSDLELAEQIRELIIKQPGFVQKQLGKRLEVSGRDTSRIVKSMMNLELIERVESGKSYELYWKSAR